MKNYYDAYVGTVKFDAYSRDTIKRIKFLIKTDKILKVILSAGVFASIFLNDKVLEVTYNITQTDWKLYFGAVGKSGAGFNHAIVLELSEAVLHYAYGDSFNNSLKGFWEGMYDAFYANQ